MYRSFLAMFGLPGGMEWVAIAIVALLIFGRRLPDVARSIGKSIVEFKRGMREVKEDIDISSRIESKPNPPLEAPTAKTPDQTESSVNAAPPVGEEKS